MAAWSAFYPFILPFVRGCDTDVVDFHVRQAAIEFCKRSQCWRQEIPITAIADTPAYLIPMPTDSVASKLLAFDVLDADGNSIDRYSLVNANRGRRFKRENRCATLTYLSDDGLTLNVEPTPDTNVVQLVPYLSLKPSQAAATFPDYLVAQNADAIANGALARLFEMPKTAWSNVADAGLKRGAFLNECGSAAVRASRGNASSQTRSRGCFY